MKDNTKILKETSVKVEFRPSTVSEYKRLRRLVGWPETEDGPTEKALRNSLFSVVATEQDTVLGIGRVIGDGGLYFYIQDLIVHPDFQGKGIGTSLMSYLMEHIMANAKSGAFIGLMAAKGLDAFYERYGFRTRHWDSPGMYRRIK